jgi:hypothetical protein
MSVRDSQVGDLTRIQNRQVAKVYFVPFDTSKVELRGNHGSDETVEENKAKWFSRVVIGAHNQFERAMPGTTAVYVRALPTPHDVTAQDAHKLKLEFAPTAPPDAFVVQGEYVSSHNIGAADRFWVGMMAGKSWTRARVTVKAGDTVVYTGTVNGKYLGGGFSYGYEILGANLGLGQAIAEVIEKLQKGEPISE